MTAETSLEKRIYFLPVLIAIIPAHLFYQKKANPQELNP